MGARSRSRLVVERLGPLPLLNHFLDRLGVEALLAKAIPTVDRRVRISHARALGVLLRSILVEREPVYRQHETVQAFAPAAFGLESREVGALADDRIGRALDRLFDADRGTLFTEIVVAMQSRFGLELGCLRNDTTSIRLTGQYAHAQGRSLRGRRAPWITYGYSKDHRPDLKQLILVVTTSDDGNLPVQFRCEDGSKNDAKTHVSTWDSLCQLAGGPNFLYVADSKLCSADAMDHIDRRRGRFVTVLPRSRKEDARFREWIQNNEPPWTVAVNRPNPRRKRGPRDVWRVWRWHLPSREGWPIVWVHSNLLALRQAARREENLARAVQDLEGVARYLEVHRPRSEERLRRRVDRILRKRRVGRYLKVKLVREPEHDYRQERPGRPGPETRYRRVTKHRWQISWTLDEAAVTYDRKSDGMYPLLTNDPVLTDTEVLTAHKKQPALEKRFSQLKSVHEIAPVFLKNEGRIEALFFLYAIALLVQGLVERELRNGMQREEIKSLPIYPEERPSRRPTALQVMRLFSHVARHTIERPSGRKEVFEAELTPLQRQLLALLGVPGKAYRN